MPTSVRQLEGEDSASLVRGVDAYRTFEHEPIPSREMDPVSVEFPRKQHERSVKILYKGVKVPA